MIHFSVTEFSLPRSELPSGKKGVAENKSGRRLLPYIVLLKKNIGIIMAALIQDSQFVSFFIYNPTLGPKEGTVTLSILDWCLQAAVVNT